MALVLDASLALAWCFPDESSEYADDVLDLLSDTEAHVPAIWALEVGNALLVGERRGRLTPAQTTRAVALLQSLPISMHGHDPARAFAVILALAREQGLSSYDASYLALAMELGLWLATSDARLREAATRTGVPIVQ